MTHLSAVKQPEPNPLSDLTADLRSGDEEVVSTSRMALSVVLRDIEQNQSDPTIAREDLVAQWAGAKPEEVIILTNGTIFDGEAWLTNNEMANFYEWIALQ